MRKISVGVIAVLALAFGMLTIAEAGTINEGFDNFQSGSRPRGWTFAYCDQNSDANTVTFGPTSGSPSVTMDTYGDLITTIQFNQSSAGTVQFWAEALALNASSALMVREYDGSTWNRVTMIYGLPTTGVVYGPLALNPSGSQQVEFSYKDTANNTDIYLDDVVIDPAATPAPTAAPVIAPTPVHLVADWDDYDGDGTSDIATYDPTNGVWDIRNVAVATAIFGGGANDIPAPGDYDGDGVADQAYFDQASGAWYAQDVATGASIINGEIWGQIADLPVVGDYDGNGTADLGTWRPSDGHWRIKGITDIWYGQAAGMYPVPGDYDGDGTTDIAMFYPTTGIWYVNGIANRYWGGPTTAFAKPMDYDGNGTTDIGIYRTDTRWWYIRDLVGPGNVNYKYWGLAGDMPAIGDFDGDGAADLTQFRPSQNRWWIMYSGTGYNYVDFSASGTDTIVDGATSY